MHKKIFRFRLGDNRKNKKYIGKVGEKFYYAEYEAIGLNIANLLNTLKKDDVLVKNVKFLHEKGVRLWVKSAQEQKFFAISKNLCYNIKKIRNCGKWLPIINLLKNPSLILGAILFVALSIFFSNFIMGFTFTGSGARYGEEVSAYLSEMGIEKYSFLSRDNLDKVSNDILSSTDKFSFVSVKKKGNRLVVELVLSKSKPYITDNGERNLISNICGIVEEVKVYRGTTLVNVGDTVNVGDILILGQMEIKEKVIEVNALGIVKIKAKKEYTYISSNDDEEEAIAFALLGFNEEAEEVKVDKKIINGKYYYKVTVYYKRIIYTG